jgi:D-galactose 1-dehydrogenase
MQKIRIGLLGVGKIAIDQHVPALEQSEDFDLVATISRNGEVPGIPAFTSLEELFASDIEVDAISICVPPVPRFALAKQALEAGKHVMLEKPPGASLAEVYRLETMAKKRNLSLYTTWHSRMGKTVDAAKLALENSEVACGKITWKEDVRHWHPGQNWVFEPGGMGVFDPGINALSILTHILPEPTHVQSASLETPSNRQTPIAAKLNFENGIVAEFDWRQEGKQTWTIEIKTRAGDHLVLENGGNDGRFNDVALAEASLGEYPMLYAEFAKLISAGQSDVDLAPMIHVSDAMTLGEQNQVDPFEF